MSMNKFWKWMQKKEYVTEENRFYYTDYCREEIPKQMLIGYMIEYLYRKGSKALDGIGYGIIDIPIDIFEGSSDINKVYEYLEKQINENK